MTITSLDQLQDESVRLEAFPVAQHKVFLGHAGVTALPGCVAEAMNEYTTASSQDAQEVEEVLRRITQARGTCARMIGAKAQEIALLGPTSLGLSLFANGLTWETGDEILCYLDDYPANVYPWLDLERHGVKINFLKPEAPGVITADLVDRAMTPKTRLVALASCHFLTGYRIDIDAIGKVVHEYGALFSLDAIQTVGAFETTVDHVDFLSADSHKWMLGPMAAGIVYVKEEHFDRLRPSLLGAWNVKSPNFITQDHVDFEPTARRYEPGVLNCVGTFGMQAALEMMLAIGQNQISARLLELKAFMVSHLKERGFRIQGMEDGPTATAITTFTKSGTDMKGLFDHLTEQRIATSYRHDREGTPFMRFSPHFYNTEKELECVFAVMDDFHQ